MFPEDFAYYLLNDNNTLILVSAQKKFYQNLKFNIQNKKLSLMDNKGKLDFIISSFARSCGYSSLKDNFECRLYKPFNMEFAFLILVKICKPWKCGDKLTTTHYCMDCQATRPITFVNQSKTIGATFEKVSICNEGCSNHHEGHLKIPKKTVSNLILILYLLLIKLFSIVLINSSKFFDSLKAGINIDISMFELIMS